MRCFSLNAHLSTLKRCASDNQIFSMKSKNHAEQSEKRALERIKGKQMIIRAISIISL